MSLKNVLLFQEQAYLESRNIVKSYEYRKNKSSVFWKLKEKEKLVPNQVLLTVRNCVC